MDLNKITRPEILREFPFLGEVGACGAYSREKDFHSAESLEIRRIDEGLLTTVEFEDSWWDGGNRLYYTRHFGFIRGGEFAGGPSVGEMVIEALLDQELPDFILETEYRDFNQWESRLELTLWKRPKNLRLLPETVERLKERMRAEIAAAMSVADK